MPKVSADYKAKRRQEVIESALLCFAEKGFESSTMDDIVERSGTSKGLVYNYFKSKEELYTSLMEERSSKMFFTFREKFQQLHTATEKLKEIFSYYQEALKKEGYQDYLKVHFEWIIYASRNVKLKQKMVDRFEKEVCAFVEEIINEGIANGEFNPNLATGSVAAIFWAKVDGISLAYALTGNQDQYRDSLIESEKMLMKYLTTQLNK
ncbi:TetR/AcrR family transcriptional regulator [Neobacillus niacini]|uniref:TetR/AcrR family transcriptional regulator n=1 Tax=Neobacillus niacini TaxID=86668 RepID=UPI003982F4CD